MPQLLAHVALLVRDYDEAIDFFTRVLGFDLLEDTDQGSGKRWVLVAPSVFLFLHTDNFWRDYRALQAHAVKFVREPKQENYGTVAVFADLYGNLWDLVERKKSS